MVLTVYERLLIIFSLRPRRGGSFPGAMPVRNRPSTCILRSSFYGRVIRELKNKNVYYRLEFFYANSHKIIH